MTNHAEQAPQRDPERVLLVRLSHLGDVVCALPLFHALRARYPRAELGWVVQHEFADLVRGLDGLDRVVLFERRGGWRAWPRLRRDLRAFAADLTVDAQANLKSAGVVLCSGAGRRVGFARPDWRERAGAWVLNETAPPLSPQPLHALDRTLHLARFVAPAPPLIPVPPRTDPAVGPGEHELGERLAERYLPSPAGAVILCLAAPGDVRSWPVERWEALARSLAAAGRAVLLVSGPAERDVGESLRQRLSDTGSRHWVGQRGLREFAAFLTVAAERGASVVSCDSGPMHLAAACGLPVVSLDGPQDAERTGPWPRATPGTRNTPGASSPHRSLRASPGPSCAPCFARRCHHASGPVCMSEIGAEAVAATVLGNR